MSYHTFTLSFLGKNYLEGYKQRLLTFTLTMELDPLRILTPNCGLL